MVVSVTTVGVLAAEEVEEVAAHLFCRIGQKHDHEGTEEDLVGSCFHQVHDDDGRKTREVEAEAAYD